METYALLLPVLEVLVVFSALILYLMDISARKWRLNYYELLLLLVTFSSPLFLLLPVDMTSRYMGLKVSFFIACIYFSTRVPKLAAVVLLLTIIVEFLYHASNGLLGTKYAFLQVTALAIPILYLFKLLDKKAMILTVFLCVCFDLIESLLVSYRTGLLVALITISLLYSKKAGAVFLRLAPYIPFIYIAIMFFLYQLILSSSQSFFYTHSNVERTAMIYGAVVNFFDYPFRGPGGLEFDWSVSALMDSLSYKLYISPKGVDPHASFLTVWRDEGALYTLVLVAIWFVFWKKVRSLWGSDFKGAERVILCLVAITVVSISLETPTTGARLTNSLSLGLFMSYFQLLRTRFNDFRV